jgi:YrbI family 3-deoxy-D-manno-octulosonate 8-phosphate phosphatase
MEAGPEHRGVTTVAIIPARGGSKGLPRKNVHPFAGRPLVAHSIAHALAATEHVYVSTDDDEIAAASREAGAQVITRPATISGDTASSESALLHAVEQLTASGAAPTTVIFLQATSPLRRPDDVRRALAQFEAEGADSLLSVAPSHDFLWTHDQAGARATNYVPAKRPRRQEMPPQFRENGSIYIMRASGLVANGCRLFGRISLYEMDQVRSFQIDTEEDFRICEALAPLIPGTIPDVSAVKLLVFDFDGVMSDNRVLVMQDGTEGVLCNRSDGLGLGMLRAAGVPMLVLSKEENPVVSARCRKLKIECRQGIDDKLTELKGIASQRGITLAQIAYVGNDVNDVPCMRSVGLPIAVSDAWPEARAVSKFRTTRPGGYGAVREVCDWFMASKSS